MNRQNGFSLIEVVVTMAIAAIVLSIGVPSFQSYIQNSRKTTSINELATALQLARNTAISRRVSITVCKSNNRSTCNTGASSGDWTQGWIVFADTSGDPTQRAPNEELLRVHSALTGNNSFIGNTNTVNRVTFSAQGLARSSNGTITFCDRRGAGNASALVISIGGQIRHATDTNNDGFIDNGTMNTAGVNVTCTTG